MKEILELIKKHETIIIHRHLNPDLDAIGSQSGLAEVIKENFPTKRVFQVGDMNHTSFLAKSDEIEDSLFNNALSIILDVAIASRVSDNRFLLASDVVVIDHHTNQSDIEGVILIDPTYGACAELLAELIFGWGLAVTHKAATALFGGIVTDTGRFQYSSTQARTFDVASKLLECGADMQYIYRNLYVEDLASKRVKSYFASIFELTKNNVAYIKNDASIYDKFDMTPFDISRGMVNQMAGIKEVPIWANFTFEPASGQILCEFRSRDISIVDVAKKYGGGGHAFACGATVASFEVADKILDDFDKLIEDVKRNA